MKPQSVSVGEIAAAIGLSAQGTWEFAERLESQYIDLPNRWIGNKHRPLVDVRPKAKKRLQGLHSFMQSRRLFHRFAQGGIKLRGYIRSARVHAGRPHVWTVDARNCYPSVKRSSFEKELRRIGFDDDTVLLLSMLCIRGDEVPQGSPVGTDAINLFFWHLDQTVASAIRGQDLRMTRVVDDFVLSSCEARVGDPIVELIESELCQRGLEVNQKKKLASGYQARPGEQLVHGLTISDGSGIGISSEEARRLVKKAESYVAACRSLTGDSFESLAATRRSLDSSRSRCRQVSFGPAKHLNTLIKSGDRHVAKKLKSLSINCRGNRWWYKNRQTGIDEPARIARILRNRVTTTTR